jgi:hypothetical protein
MYIFCRTADITLQSSHKFVVLLNIPYMGEIIRLALVTLQGGLLESRHDICARGLICIMLLKPINVCVHHKLVCCWMPGLVVIMICYSVFYLGIRTNKIPQIYVEHDYTRYKTSFTLICIFWQDVLAPNRSFSLRISFFIDTLRIRWYINC